MLQSTARRVSDPGRFGEPVVIANVEHRFLVAEQLRAAGIRPRVILLESEGRNSAPAAAVAARRILAEDPGALLLLLAADHAMTRPEVFIEAVDRARPAAEAGLIVTFGIRPDRPETGYGYVLAGRERPGEPGVHTADRFVEKPDAATASGYLADGRYLWNSGNFSPAPTSWPARSRGWPRPSTPPPAPPSPVPPATSTSSGWTRARSPTPRRSRSTTRSWRRPTGRRWCRAIRGGATSARSRRCAPWRPGTRPATPWSATRSPSTPATAWCAAPARWSPRSAYRGW